MTFQIQVLNREKPPEFRRRTEVNIPIDHCELYHIHLPSQIVINLRELRSILHFVDCSGMAITMHFDRPGRPMILAVEENIDFSAEFVLGTLYDSGPNQPVNFWLIVKLEDKIGF